MFPMVITVMILVFVPILIILKKDKLLFSIAILSFFTDFMFITISKYSFWCAGYICIWYLIIEKENFLKQNTIFGRILWIELWFMALVGSYFVFISPWNDYEHTYRTVTQQLPLRTLIGLLRFVETNLFFYYFFHIFKKKYISIEFFTNFIFWVVLCSVFFGVIDLYLTSGAIRIILMPKHYALSRFTGLTGEPRAIGQLLTYSLFIFMTFGLSIKNFKTKATIGIVLSFLGIGLSFSSTAIGYSAITLIIYSLLGKMDFKYIFLIITTYVFGFLLLRGNDDFVQHQNKRLALVTLEERSTDIWGAPAFVNRFEIFDKLALIFLYLNPEYLIFGVGPNTINIPASKYLTGVEESDYGGKIDSVPANFLINVLSRSGIIGISIYLLTFLNIKKRLILHNNKPLLNYFFLITIYSIFYNNIFLYASIGIVLGYYFSETEKIKFHNPI
jgi:hypothetical protein